MFLCEMRGNKSAGSIIPLASELTGTYLSVRPADVGWSRKAEEKCSESWCKGSRGSSWPRSRAVVGRWQRLVPGKVSVYSPEELGMVLSCLCLSQQNGGAMSPVSSPPF